MNLFGWDTAFAIDLAMANRALARAGDSVLVDFDASGPEGLGIRAAGAFGNWQIVPGGSGEFVYLRLPIVRGELTLSVPEPRSVPLAGTAFVASVALDLLPSPSPDVENLRFDVTSAARVGAPAVAGAITPIRIDDPDGVMSDAEEALLLVALATFVAENASRISFIFATINLVPPSTNGWLTPVRSAFAYADRADGSGGSLVILSVTTDREIGHLPRKVDPALLSPGYQAGFAFSAALFLQYVIMPALPASFGNGATPANFTFDTATSTIVNVGALAMDQVKSGAIWYSPIVRSLKLGLASSSLQGRFSGDCDLKAGISMTFWVEPTNEIVYDAATRSLGFLSDPDARSGHQAHIPWYWWFGGLVVRLIVEIVVSAIASNLAGSLTRNVGAFLSPTRNPPTSIEWAQTKDLLIGSASVAGDFVMLGNFADPAGPDRRRGF